MIVLWCAGGMVDGRPLLLTSCSGRMFHQLEHSVSIHFRRPCTSSKVPGQKQDMRDSMIDRHVQQPTQIFMMITHACAVTSTNYSNLVYNIAWVLAQFYFKHGACQWPYTNKSCRRTSMEMSLPRDARESMYRRV